MQTNMNGLKLFGILPVQMFFKDRFHFYAAYSRSFGAIIGKMTVWN